MTRKPFFYDSQLKRMLAQLMSMFHGYQVVTGNQADGTRKFMDVPIIYGDMSRVAGYIMNGGSSSGNTMAYLPVMSLYMTALAQKAEWRLNPQHTEKYHYVERAKDPEGKLYVNAPGKHLTVEKYQPVPYDLSFSLSFWCSNSEQEFQLIEQIGTVFNPDMEVQLSNSPTDDGFLTMVWFQGDFRREKAVPSGTDTDPLYITTLDFKTVIYMHPPAKVYDTTYIYSIHVPIKELEEGIDFDSLESLDGLVIRASEQDILTFESFN